MSQLKGVSSSSLRFWDTNAFALQCDNLWTSQHCLVSSVIARPLHDTQSAEICEYRRWFLVWLPKTTEVKVNPYHSRSSKKLWQHRYIIQSAISWIFERPFYAVSITHFYDFSWKECQLKAYPLFFTSTLCVADPMPSSRKHSARRPKVNVSYPTWLEPGQDHKLRRPPSHVKVTSVFQLNRLQTRTTQSPHCCSQPACARKHFQKQSPLPAWLWGRRLGGHLKGARLVGSSLCISHCAAVFVPWRLSQFVR